MESSFLPSIGTVSPLMSSGGSPVAPRARDHHPWCCLLMNRSIPGINDGSGALNHQKAGEQSWNNPAPLQNFGLGFLTSLGGGYWDKLLAPSPRGVSCVSQPGLASAPMGVMKPLLFPRCLILALESMILLALAALSSSSALAGSWLALQCINHSVRS